MSQNISKYVQLTDFLLLEYEFSRDGEEISFSDPWVVETTTGKKQFFDYSDSAIGVTNNALIMNSVATDGDGGNWFNNYKFKTEFFDYFEASTLISTNDYAHDTVKVHIISGYNFDDVAGFLLQIKAKDGSANLVDLSNFTYIKQPETLGNGDVTKFSANSLYLGNKFYDKYVEFKIPSVYALGNDTTSDLGQELNIEALSDVYMTYSTLPTIQAGDLGTDNVFTLVEETDLQLPVTSTADRFNAFIAEATDGDYIEYYATFDDQIIGQFMGDIESGRIPLYTSNNPNDNYQEFTETYGTDTPKWVLIHELFVYEHFGNSSVLTQKFSFTQDSNFSLANRFRPVLQNADIDSSYTIQYICRLSNRMDGSQIIRRASFSSTDPKKYGLEFTRINVDNIIPYRVYNKIEDTQPEILQTGLKPQTKYVKIFYDTTNVVYNEKNEIYPQGTGALYLRNSDSVYKFKFERQNETSGNLENVDLSGAFNYGLLFVLDDDTKLEVGPTYSSNMNTTIGSLEFKLNKEQVDKLLIQNNKNFSIIVKNPDGSSYNFYEGQYYSYQKRVQNEVDQQNYLNQIQSLTANLNIAEGQLSGSRSSSFTLARSVQQLNKKNAALRSENRKLKQQNAQLLENQSEAPETEETGLTQGTIRPNERVLRRQSGPEVGIAAKKKSLKVKPSREIVERDEKIKQLERENETLTRKNITLENDQPSSGPMRKPSKERPTSSNKGPAPLQR